MFTQSLPVIAVLIGMIALAEWLARNTWMRHLSAALLVIVFAAVASNLNLIPSYGAETPVYGAIFQYIAPLGIFWLLLLVDLKSAFKVGGPTMTLFLIGAAGTVLGAVIGHWAVGGKEAFGELHAAITGMFTGTYIGGSVNFNAVALEYHVVEDGAIYTGAAAVDNAMTAIWMAACVALPRMLAGLWPLKMSLGSAAVVQLPVDDEIETTSVFDMSIVIALGIGAVALSEQLASDLFQLTGITVPSTLVLTTFALLLAQLPVVQRLHGARLLGLFAVYLFLAVIGTLCDLQALLRMGDLAPLLGVFVCILIGVHGIVIFAAAWLLKLDPATAAVASQANIGGGTTALALARSLGRKDLELPAILVGSVGLVLGNYLGFLVAGLLAG